MIAWTRRIVLTITILGLLTTNVLTLTSMAFNAALSGAMSTVLGIQTVADVISQRTKATAAKRKVATKNFGTKFRARTRRVAARSIGAIPAEAIPYLGIGVVLATTGYELYEACQGLIDLEELYTALEIETATDEEAMRTVCQPELPDPAKVWEGVKAKSSEWVGKIASTG